MAKNFNTLRDKMSPESLARARAKAAKYTEEMALDELRAARDLTQETLAELLNVKQSAISKMERRTDMYVTTLNKIVKAMGGDLCIEAVFPDGRVKISQFGKLRKIQKVRPLRKAAG